MLIVLDDSAIFVYNLKPSVRQQKLGLMHISIVRPSLLKMMKTKKAVQYGQNHQIVNKVELSLTVKQYI